MGSTRLTSSNVSLNGISSPSETFVFAATVVNPGADGITSSYRFTDSSRNIFTGGTKADANGGMLVKTDKYGAPLFSIIFKDNQSYCYSYLGCSDSSGNIYIPMTQYNSFNPKVGMVKLNSSGVLQFQRTMTITASSSVGGYGWAAAVDSSGNIYIAGGARENGSSTLMPYLVKFDSAGNTSWQRRLQTSSVTSLDSYFMKGCIGILSDGSVVVGGNYYVNSTGNDANTLLARYTSAGAISWQKAFSSGTNIIQQATGLAIDSSDNIFLLASSQDNPNATFLLKYNSSGTLQWQRRISRSGVAANAGDYSIAVAPDGNIVIGIGVASTGVFILTYNQSGVLQWTKKLLIRTGALETSISGLFIDNAGFLHIGIPHSDFTSGSGSATVAVKIPYGNLSKDLSASIMKFSYQYTTSTGEMTDAAGGGTEPSITFTSGDFSTPYAYSGAPGNNNNISVNTTSYIPGIIKENLS